MSDPDIGAAEETDTDSRADHAKRVAVTGTPGTGKSTATAILAEEHDFDVVHLNDLIKEDDDLWTERDAERDTLEVDIDAVADHLGDWSGILDSHLAHHFETDRVVVLRCHPEELERRLRERGEPAAKAEENTEPDKPSQALARKARENAESEALDVILSEAVATHGMESVYEIDATERSPEAIADEIRAVVEGNREPSAGTVDFTGYL